jgi:hypothetical protein
MNDPARAGRGFAIWDAAAVLAVAVALAAFLFPAASNHRRLARLGDDVAKLKTIGACYAQYAADFADQFCTLSWRSGQS